jgi:hypothetical protein
MIDSSYVDGLLKLRLPATEVRASVEMLDLAALKCLFRCGNYGTREAVLLDGKPWNLISINGRAVSSI